MLYTFLAFIFVFGILVCVHELGHFLTARMFGVKVLEFAFGFPPRLFSRKRKGTEYSINAIPLGGYVRLLGEDWKKTKTKDNLVNKKPYEKVIIMASGVVMNFLLAWLLLTAFYIFGGMPIVPKSWEYKGVTNNLKVYMIDVNEGKAVQKAGILDGDLLLAVNGTRVYRHQEAMEVIDASIAADKVKPIKLTVEKGGKSVDKEVTPYEEDGVSLLGFGLENKGYIKAVWYLAPIIAVREIWHISVLTFQGFGEFFRILFTKFKIAESVGGPVAIFQLSGTAAHMGVAIFTQFIVLLSISLAILNIMPFPALDGGHIAFIVIEKLRGKEIKKEVKETIIKWGFMLLLFLVAVITINDIIRSGAFNFIRGILK